MKKLFEVLNHYQENIMLDKEFYLDETYVKCKPSKARIDSQGRKLRGLSTDKICIVTATDNNNALLFIAGNGKPSSNRILNAMSGHIAPGSIIIDDQEKAHNLLIEKYHLIRESYSSSYTKKLKDEDNPLNRINSLHKYFKQFISRHYSYNRENLQSWCNLFSFIYNHKGNVADMVFDILKMSIFTKKVVRYREAMIKKHD